MLVNYDNYKPSLTKFLNQFSSEAKHFSAEKVKYFEKLFKLFLEKAFSS
jgi:hypothetical protein